MGTAARIDTTDDWALHEREWRDPANWRGGWLGIYVASRDPHLIVRKRAAHMGWTLNFAHRASWWIMLASLAAAVALIAAGISFDR
jgi:uncharacterized membrane protein